MIWMTHSRVHAGQMVSWWFNYCEDSARYQLWHPVDHADGRWSDGYYQVGGIPYSHWYLCRATGVYK